MSPTLTIFTPTYNRADLLTRGYQALKQQKCKDFEWLIVDDGSTDNTRDVVCGFQEQDNGFEIKYIYKENGGLHTGYNCAIAHADTELCMCVDSDDWIAENAVERILMLWGQVKRDDCAGIVAQDIDPDGNPTCVIDGSGYINLNAYDVTHRWAGDRKLVIRTELYKAVAPMPSFPGEKNFNPQYMHYKIAQDYTFYVLNEPICIVDYQDTGMSAGIYKQFLNSPNSFAEFRRMQMTMRPNNWKFIIKSAIHYDSSCILAGKYSEIATKSPRKVLTMLVMPIGYALSRYIQHKAELKHE